MAKSAPDWAAYHYRGQNRKKRRLAFRLALFFSGALFLAGTFYALFFVLKLNSLEKEINPSRPDARTLLETARSLVDKSELNLKGVGRGRINILLLGIAGKNKPGKNLTDTLMVASVDTETDRIALFSIPRDLFVKIPGHDFQNKINTVYQYGISSSGDEAEAAQLISETVENITALNIDYYVVLNFDGFEKIIDSIGGINIMNERDIYDARYPGPNYSYETFELAKGFHHLDGKTALKYVRERHNDPEGDFGRAKRQQQVLQATKNKAFSAETMLNVLAINDIFNALGEAIQTNITPDEIGSFLELSKRLDTQNINNFVLDAWNKNSLLKVAHVFYGDLRAFVLVPRVGNWSEVQDVAQNIFDLNALNRRREAIASENASVLIINQSGDYSLAGKIKKLLSENLEYKNISAFDSRSRTIQEKTFVYDLSASAKPFTLDELIKKLPATLAEEEYSLDTKDASGKEPDIVIRLGKDLADIYNVEEGTLDDLNNARDEQESTSLQSK